MANSHDDFTPIKSVDRKWLGSRPCCWICKHKKVYKRYPDDMFTEYRCIYDGYVMGEHVAHFLWCNNYEEE